MTEQIETAPSTEEASTNFYWTCGNEQVFNLQTTVRGVLNSAQIHQHVESVKQALGIVVNLGGKARANGKGNDPAPIPLPASPMTGAASSNPQAIVTLTTPAATAPAGPQAELTFPAETLVGSILEGKPSWKVKGGRFTQFGVTIWPEALAEAGLKVEPGNTYTLAGYTAYYVSKPDGKPQKVVRLKL